ncbi:MULTISPECIES: hypothetical protein [Bacillaceae]|uniref:hypothetical protein n=1 Tax=Bacillaceae TaxID=186817 RepID=UPI000C77C561|nr:MULTISPECIES: hypothetical protein [Bacillaceae]PLR65657.1 hypothetical protein CYJ36_22690 [Bacillus sp. UMB0893]
MSKKVLDLQDDISVLFGIYFAVRFIYTKEVYIQIYGYTVNTLSVLILTIVLVAIHRQDKKTSKEINSIKEHTKQNKG